MTVPIPQYEHLFLPAWPQLLIFLSTLTFWVHLLLVGIVVGGSIFLLSRVLRKKSPLDQQLDRRILKVIPVCISLTITFGVAPLLFTQALYGQYFYSANILIAPFWLGSLGFLMIGFISIYLACKFRSFIANLIFLLIVVLCFITVLYIFTNNAVLSLQPEHWLEFHRGEQVLHVRDATLNPRVLHNIGATLVISGLAITWIGRFRSDDKEARDHAVKTGMHWLMIGLVLQVAFGLWYVIAVPGAIRSDLINFTNLTSIAWYLAVIFVFLNLFTAMKAIIMPGQTKWLIYSTLLPTLGLVGMLLARQYLRTAYLARKVAGNFKIQDWHVIPQTQQFLIFAVLLGFTLLIIVLTMVLVLKSKSAAKEINSSENQYGLTETE
jgi:hypothetical protein